MNGLKYYALIGGMTLAISCPQIMLAADDASSAKTDAESKPAFNELQKGNDRGITFGQIFAPANVPKTMPVAVPVHRAQPPSHTTKGTTSKGSAPLAKGQQTDEHQSNIVPVAHTALINPNAVISAWLDKQGTTPKYRAGEKMVVHVAASTDCNLVIFDYDTKGTLTQLFPNEYQQSGFVRAGESVEIGGSESKFDYEVGGKGGLERIFVYAYPTTSEKPLTVAMGTVPHSPFRSVEMSIDKYRDMVNNSKVFFSREVKILPKQAAARPIANAELEKAAQPNKVELTFLVDNK